jgi:16S rRNA (guanine(966)-N(2))-methyltransferase RsmD
MRIVSGTHRGRAIHPPKNMDVRPTTDFAKESIFNIINNYFELDGLTILDLFAGTGNISYEFASRGCGSITSIDNNYTNCEFIKRTIEQINLKAIKVVKSDAFAFLKRIETTYHIIFADPPYALDKIATIPELVFSQKLLKPNGWLIVEHSEAMDLSAMKYFKEKRTYGNVNFSIFEMPEETVADK